MTNVFQRRSNEFRPSTKPHPIQIDVLDFSTTPNEVRRSNESVTLCREVSAEAIWQFSDSYRFLFQRRCFPLLVVAAPNRRAFRS